jgi:hypothetical protein
MADNQFINFNSQDVADMYRRNQYARMLQEQANAPIERASYKGIEAPLHPVQGVAKMAAALLAGYQQNQMDKRYTNEKAAAEQKLVDERERRRAEVEQYRMGEEPTLSTGPSGGVQDYGTPPTISTAKTPGQLLAHRLNALGSETESVRNIAKASIEQQNAVDQNTAKAAEKERDRLDREAEIKRLQGNADRSFKQSELASERTYNLQLESLKKGRLPTQKETAETDKAEKSKTNVATTLRNLSANYDELRNMGGMRTQDASPLGNIMASAENALPYTLQDKKRSLLREKIDSDLQAIVKPAMLASGMTAKEADTPSEVARFLKTLGGAHISHEANQPILERVYREVVGGEDNPYSKESRIKSVMDKYAPKGK